MIRSIVFPSEARYVGEHGTAGWSRSSSTGPAHTSPTALAAPAGADRRVRARLRHVRPRLRALEGFELVPFDVEFDHARAVKSDAELESVRESVRINEEGFEVFFDHYGATDRPPRRWRRRRTSSSPQGCGRLTMNMVLTGPNGKALPEFKIARKDELLGDFMLPSLEVAGPGMHWVEVSRAIASSDRCLERCDQEMMDAYDEYFEAARSAMRAGATAHDVHRAVAKGFLDRGYVLGHVTGHSIGMTMIEHPKIGEGVDTELAANMVFSMHPHSISPDGGDCLYMQDTWLVTAAGGVPLSRLPMQIYVKE